MTSRTTRRPPSDGPRAPRLHPIAEVTREALDPADVLTHTNLELVELTGDLTGVDLTGVGLGESRLVDITARELTLGATSFVDTVIERLDVPALTGPSGALRDVTLTDSRIGSADLSNATWRSVHLVGCRLGYVNLHGSRLTDVLFTDCTIDELDLTAAVAERVAFAGTSLRALTVQQARLTDVDLRSLDPGRIDGIEGLRGATLNSRQLDAVAPALARALGIHIVDA
ncbi:pentapeptide repeat-containing protein [Microbacterium sp. NPDC089189]|uniref:pentapeptide repeat-containing protein n=1 Tax=Microbacterium sp. NPDC089189 TaxID=3154972 RepID=UPI0034383E6A